MTYIREIIRDHPDYGYRRILPELRERSGERVNHKRLRRLLREHELGLPRYLPNAKPSPVREILREASDQLNLVEAYLGTDREPEPLSVFSTDFTELAYASGQRKAHLMAVVDVGSRCALGWAVGPSANRALALRCWKQVRTRMTGLGQPLEGSVLHSDLDSVYTSFDWLRQIRLDDGLRVSDSELLEFRSHVRMPLRTKLCRGVLFFTPRRAVKDSRLRFFVLRAGAGSEAAALRLRRPPDLRALKRNIRRQVAAGRWGRRRSVRACHSIRATPQPEERIRLIGAFRHNPERKYPGRTAHGRALKRILKAATALSICSTPIPMAACQPSGWRRAMRIVDTRSSRMFRKRSAPPTGSRLEGRPGERRCYHYRVPG